MTDATTEAPRKVMIYLNPHLQSGFELVFEHLKRQGLVPARAENMNKYRAAIMRWLVDHAVEDIERNLV